MSKWRTYRQDYMTVHLDDHANFLDDIDSSVSIYAPEKEFRGIMHEWCAANGYSKVKTAATEDGFCQYQAWGLSTDDGRIYAGRINRCFRERRAAQRAAWPTEAADLCERYEKRICDLFRQMDLLSDQIEKAQSDERSLRSALANSQRETRAAEAAAEELRKRVREADPNRIRREIAAEFDQKTANITAERNQLASLLHEATSRETKLADDKKRLRMALNSARGK